MMSVKTVYPDGEEQFADYLNYFKTGLTKKKKTGKNDPCVKAMGVYSKPKSTPKSTQQTAPVRSPTTDTTTAPASSAKQAPQKTNEGVTGTVKRNVGNVLDGAGEAVKGVGNALKGLFGGGK